MSMSPQNTFALRDTPRFELAAADFELNVANCVKVFSCALNTTITKDMISVSTFLPKMSGGHYKWVRHFFRNLRRQDHPR
jgi:hypothetical protein